MEGQGPYAEDQGTKAPGSPGAEGEPDQGVSSAPAAAVPAARGGGPARRRKFAAGLIGAIGVSIVSLLFIVSFIGALHDPGPRSVPVGLVGTHGQASSLNTAFSHKAPGAFVITRYPTVAAAHTAILNRTLDAAVVPGPPTRLLVAAAVGHSLTGAVIKAFEAAASAKHVPLTVQDIRPLPPSDPDNLSQVFFIIALLSPSLIFGNLLVKRLSSDLHPLIQLGLIVIYAAIAAAIAAVFADAVIGALVGSPWGIFGIGALLSFAAAVMAAASTRWTGGIGYAVIGLLFIAVGIPASGTALGPQMITPWYADLGRALPTGSSITAIQNTVYFNGNAITTPLVIVSAWALAGVIAMVMAAILHPALPGLPAQSPDQSADLAAQGQPTGRHARVGT